MQTHPKPIPAALFLIVFTGLSMIFPGDVRDAVALPVSVNEVPRQLIERKHKTQPVELLGVTNMTGSIKLGEQFSADDDWLKGLSLTVKNVSSQKVRFIEFELTALRTKDVGDPTVALYHVNSGPLKTESSKLILPGDSLQLTLGDQDYQIFQQLLLATKYDTVEKAELSLHQVVFEDDTIWLDGELRQRKGGKLEPLLGDFTSSQKS